MYEWIVESGRSGANSRRVVTIHLLNDEQQPVFTRRLRHAWVTKYSSGELNAGFNTLAMETMELVHEGLIIE